MSIDPSTFCSIISMIFTFLSAVIFGLKAIREDKEIEEMSATVIDGNVSMANALKEERKWAWIGLFFLALGLGFQSISFYFK